MEIISMSGVWWSGGFHKKISFLLLLIKKKIFPIFSVSKTSGYKAKWSLFKKMWHLSKKLKLLLCIVGSKNLSCVKKQQDKILFNTFMENVDACVRWKHQNRAEKFSYFWQFLCFSFCFENSISSFISFSKHRDSIIHSFTLQ